MQIVIVFSVLLFVATCGARSPFAGLPNCTSDFREFNGICTTTGRRAQRLWGSTNRIQFTYFVGRGASEPSGGSRPSARMISNAVFKQDKKTFDRRGLSEIAAYFAQFILHDVSITPESEDERFDILVPPGDLTGRFPNGIPFLRSVRGFSALRDKQQLPINMQTSAVDLSVLYGATKRRANAIRSGAGGMLALSEGNLLPILPGSRRLTNFPAEASNYFLSGDPRANENPVLTSLHTIFAREHNRIAKEIAMMFPRASDEEIFRKARLINSAQFQKIVFEEWYPAMAGKPLPRYRGFKKDTDPTVSVSFSTAAFQVHHSMTGKVINRLGPNNEEMRSLKKNESFFREVSTLQTDGVEIYLRGALHTRAMAIDTSITAARRNFLYSNIPGLETKVDIAAELIQRGRDHGLPAYILYRARFGESKALKIKDITSNPEVRKILRKVYQSASSIDPYVGLLAEDHAKGASMGGTMLKIWMREFRRLREGDRLYFRSKKGIPKDLMDVPTVQKLLAEKDTFRRILLRNTGITATELPQELFFST